MALSNPIYFKIDASGKLVPIMSSNIDGSRVDMTLNQLSDAPSYTGNAGKFLRVMSTEDGVEATDVLDAQTNAGSPAGSVSGESGQLIFDTDNSDLYVCTGGTAWVKIGGLTSPSAFTDLSDAPSSYTGLGGKAVKVKSDESGLEFGDIGWEKIYDESANTFPDAYPYGDIVMPERPVFDFDNYDYGIRIDIDATKDLKGLTLFNSDAGWVGENFINASGNTGRILYKDSFPKFKDCFFVLETAPTFYTHILPFGFRIGYHYASKGFFVGDSNQCKFYLDDTGEITKFNIRIFRRAKSL